MALRIPSLRALRWPLATVAACGLVAAALLRAMPQRDATDPAHPTFFSSMIGPYAWFDWNWTSVYTPTKRARLATANVLAKTNNQLYLLERRDSLLAGPAVARARAAGLAVEIDPAFSAATRALIDSVAREEWRRLGTTNDGARPGVPVVYAVIFDSVQKAAHGLPRTAYMNAMRTTAFLPERGSDAPCVVVTRLGGDPLARTRRWLRTSLIRGITSPAGAASTFGACAYLAAFGQPGPGVATWLRDNQWAAAQLADWTHTPERWRAPRRPNYWAANPITAFLSMNDDHWVLRYSLAERAIACTAGDVQGCRAAYVGERPPMPTRAGSLTALMHLSAALDSTWYASVATSAGMGDVDEWVGFQSVRLGFGPLEGWILSDMVRALGRDRFASFWRSPLPVDDAFRAAAGRDLGDWTRDWAQRVYGADQRGPALASAALGTGLTIAVAAVGLVLLVARRRRIGM